MNLNTSTYFQDWAYDINKDPVNGAELYDVDVINQSIEAILGTVQGERLFNPLFGAGLMNRVFDGMTVEWGESLLDDLVDQIKFWEDRITIIESDLRLVVNTDQNFIIIVIPYIIKRNGIRNVFKKKIIA